MTCLLFHLVVAKKNGKVKLKCPKKSEVIFVLSAKVDGPYVNNLDAKKKTKECFEQMTEKLKDEKKGKGPV